ncbi:MAG TPA: hypothetical protein DEQ61_06640, partial [Streptomyces sp.]|nr:hypothetical protein [Streptomyces sp.]
MSAPQLDVVVAAPVLAPAIASVVVLVLDAVAPRRRRPAVAVGVLALLTTLVVAIGLRLRASAGGEVTTLCLPGDPALAVRDAPGQTASECLLRVSQS